MKVKLNKPMFIGTHSHAAGDVVELEERRARDLVKGGKAERVHEDTELTQVPDPNAPKQASNSGEADAEAKQKAEEEAEAKAKAEAEAKKQAEADAKKNQKK